jgi:3-oxoacyl-(acyl-carrier-protein) synthase
MREQQLDAVAKASFGFGDVNGCVIFKRWNGGEGSAGRPA